MRQPVLLLVLVGVLFVGGLLGSLLAGRGESGLDERVAALQEENARLRLTLGERGARGGEGGPGMGGRAEAIAKGELRAPPAKAFAPAATFDVGGFEDPDVAFQALLAYAVGRLDAGPEGHLELLRTVGATFFAPAGRRQVATLVGGDAQAQRYVYPILRFVLNREDQLADLAETVFRTMAEAPGRLEDVEAGALALVVEDIAPMLPGVVGDARLERFRAHARAVLAADRAVQPTSVERQRTFLQQALASWSPPLGREEAFQRLQQGVPSPEEATALLRRLEPEDLARLDVERLLGPLLEQDPWTIIAVVARAKPDAATLEALDGHVIQGVVAGRLAQSVVQYWLRHTGREAFAAAKTFYERGLQQAQPASAGTFLLAALASKPGPDDAWVAWAEGRYEFSDEVRVALMRMRERKREQNK